jgi:hypothetical protein
VADVSFASVRFICSGPLDLQRGLQIDIPPGLRSTSGPAVNAGKALAIVTDPTLWIDWAEGTKLFKPSI